MYFKGLSLLRGQPGPHKAIPLTFANHYWSATASAYRLGYAKSDCWLHCMPLCHVGGLALLFRCLLFGFSLHLSSEFDIEEIKGAILERRITIASFVPTMLVRLLDADPSNSTWTEAISVCACRGSEGLGPH